MLNTLNTLLNQVLKTNNENYTEGADNIDKCYSKFSVLSQENNNAFQVFYYLFPNESCQEQNMDEFWFIKYKKDLIYDEYDFCIDLLNTLNDSTDEISFQNNVKNISKKFGNYKSFFKYFSIIKDHGENLLSINAYFTKDSDFFRDFLDVHVLSENIQTPLFIEIIKDIFKDDHIEYEDKIVELESEIESLKARIESLNERVEKIELKGTIEICFKYLYKVLSSKFKEVKKSDNLSDQIEQILIILKKPEFKEYNFIVKFIDSVVNNKLFPLNNATKDYPRNLGDIKKILQSYYDDDLNPVVNFFSIFPKMKEFININIINYSNPDNADKEFQKLVRYEKAYSQIFG